MNLPDITVVIPTCGRPELLARCLAALDRQTLARDRYEVLVVEDRHRDGPAATRNRGWLAAQADVVAFTDDDTEPDVRWLEVALSTLQRTGADAVVGRVMMPLPDLPTDYERDAQGLERAEFVTANCVLRKSALRRIDGFDERFRMAWREDSDLQFRLLAAGARIVHDPEAIVVHPVRPAQWGVSLRQQKKTMFDALLYRKHPRLYRERIRARPRWDYWLVVALLAAWIAGFAAGAEWLAVPALALWLGFTAVFCARRLEGTSRHPAHVLEMIVTSALIPPLSVFWRIVGALRYRVAFA